MANKSKYSFSEVERKFDIIKDEEVKVNQDMLDVIDALKALGYKMNEINPVINKIKDEDLTIEAYIKKALGLLMK